MKFAYADPPYLGCGKLYTKHHPEARAWDDPETHRRLFERLFTEYPDGWVLSCSSPSLEVLLPMVAGRGCRVGSWNKPFASFKPGVNPGYTWEPVIFTGGRKRGRREPTIRDHFSHNIMVKKGLTGAKPPKVCEWIIALLGADPAQDTFEDLFPGTGIFGATWAALAHRGAGAEAA